MIEAMLVIFAVYISKQPETRNYPIGKSSIESIGSLLIGLVLFIIGAIFLLKAILGLLLFFDIFPLLSSILLYVVKVPEKVDILVISLYR